MEPDSSRSARTARIEIHFVPLSRDRAPMSRSARTARIEIYILSYLTYQNIVAVRKDRED